MSEASNETNVSPMDAMIIAVRLVQVYKMDPPRIAKALDEQIDRSGYLLGVVREAARTEQPHDSR